jgi:hypothetical protein
MLWMLWGGPCIYRVRPTECCAMERSHCRDGVKVPTAQLMALVVVWVL